MSSLIKGKYWICIILVLLSLGCANIVPPGGGPKDTTPPVMLSLQPKDSSMNINPTKITAGFNKYMVVQGLETKLQVSPMLSTQPIITAFGKKIEIKISDSLLQPNTTYRISLGNALTDNREATPYPDFVYLFSTGNYFDSLEIQGKVTDAFTNQPDTSILVALYPADIQDSAIFSQKPMYVTYTNATGYFQFQTLPNRPFRIFGIQDIDNNYTYTPFIEKIAFDTNIVMPQQLGKTSEIHLQTFLEATTDSTAANVDTISNEKEYQSVSQRGQRPGATKKTKSEIGYIVHIDTSNTDKRTFELDGKIEISLDKTGCIIDKNRIYLSYNQDEIEVEAVLQTDIDSTKIVLKTEWQEDKIYTLRLVKGWAKDSLNVELPPGKYSFRTNKQEDYATLIIEVDSTFRNQKYLMQVQNENEQVYLNKIIHTRISIPFLKPGSYRLSIIEDSDGNGKWTTGSYLEKRMPERVINYPHGSITLRTGWENKIDFKVLQENENTESPNKDSEDSK